MRNEFPNPQFERSEWISLNGTWNFQFDDEHVGHRRHFETINEWPMSIEVPFAFQSIDSGIHDLGFHDHVWYRRTFEVPKEMSHRRVILHVGACDYYSEVFLNGKMMKTHEGGHSSYEVDVTDALNHAEENLVLYVFDPSEDEFIPRGKQYWKRNHESIWYPRTTGLWQPIWLEFVDEKHIKTFVATPDIDKGTLHLHLETTARLGDYLEIDVKSMEGQEVFHSTISIAASLELTIPIFASKVFAKNVHGHGRTWSPEHPYLFSLTLVLKSRELICDRVMSYFGMRKIHIDGDVVFLNNRPYYQKLILDQGYYPTGLLTAPTDDDFVKDIVMAKQMGFNGCRKHQIASDPRFLYHADRLGFLVWGEMANCINYSRDAARRLQTEWTNIIMRDINHPSIVAWVPINESWGVPDINHSTEQQSHALAMYHTTKSLDHSRPVISNDGWEMVQTDYCAIHNYAHGRLDQSEKQAIYQTSLQTKEGMLAYLSAGRNLYANGYQYEGEPILLTEFGGIAFQSMAQGWGYTEVHDEESLVKELTRIFADIRSSKCLRGYCYTQLTDVFQEENGLLTFDRKFKVDPDRIKALNDSIQPLINKTTSTQRRKP